MSNSLCPIPYCPPEYNDSFEHDLSLFCGFTLTGYKQPAPDGEVIRPRWIVTPTGISYTDQTFHTLFNDAAFRTLLRCILSQQRWKREDLSQHFGARLTKKQRSLYLTYCQEQAFLEQQGSDWRRGPQLQQISNLGHTFEWVVMEYLRVQHHMLARYCVHLQEMTVQGDLDVVALRDNFSIMVECKSSSSTITKQSIHLFVQRATEFRPDIALFLIDTCSEEALRCRFQQLEQETLCSGHPASACRLQCGSVYWVTNNLFLANTATGIHSTLDAAIQIGYALKDLTQFMASKSCRLVR
ncbi:hypothetical protein KDA_76290 [Dictyobacter alpinus]|uniref:Uncharacterized protein n=1 Tax=Dictyobacter alpinus TaxID=2014873 RepID=A0A402BL98_9CHLR|nr:hypothetical protein [Dictyobacter alpinus]GCE32145.1 hypothetical protein KDA_76290 [Dictyobacter alpinus]